MPLAVFVRAFSPLKMGQLVVSSEFVFGENATPILLVCQRRGVLYSQLELVLMGLMVVLQRGIVGLLSRRSRAVVLLVSGQLAVSLDSAVHDLGRLLVLSQVFQAFVLDELIARLVVSLACVVGRAY